MFSFHPSTDVAKEAKSTGLFGSPLSSAMSASSACCSLTIFLSGKAEAWTSAGGDAAERGVLPPPFSKASVGRVVSIAELPDAVHLLKELQAAGVEGRGLGTCLRLAACARRVGETKSAPSLVWSDIDLTGARDTAVVCRELFREAETNVLLSTFSLGHKVADGKEQGNPVLKPLAERMAVRPKLKVRLFVNLRRLETMANANEREIEDAFVAWFRRDIWPWESLPEVYYDPRSLNAQGEDSSCLHAKCVVVDDARSFITSANLTEAAHARNIEAGVLLDDPVFARHLRRQFESLVDRRYVRRLRRGLS